MAPLALAALSTALGGCPADDEHARQIHQRIGEDGKALFGRPPQPTPVNADAGPRVPLVRLNATAVAFPVGTLTRSETIWSKLNSKPWPADTRALLSLNGLRVGLLKGDAWPDLAKTFTDLRGIRLKSTSLPAFAASPVRVFLQREDLHQTIFTFRLNGTMFGMDYPPGDMLMSVNCIADPANPFQVTLGAIPIVQSARTKMRYTKTGGRYTFIQRPDMYAFGEAAAQATIASTDVVVIGPGIGAERASSVGNRFFFRQVDGAMFETVLLLTPTVTMVNAPGRPPTAPVPGSGPNAGKSSVSTRSDKPDRSAGTLNSLRR